VAGIPERYRRTLRGTGCTWEGTIEGCSCQRGVPASAFAPPVALGVMIQPVAASTPRQRFNE
jgi:hypothetical protein